MKSICYSLAALAIIIGAYRNSEPKVYSVVHTFPDWQNNVNGSLWIKEQVRYSDIPANVRRVIDSISDAHINDISSQVSAAIQKDTVKVKK